MKQLLIVAAILGGFYFIKTKVLDRAAEVQVVPTQAAAATTPGLPGGLSVKGGQVDLSKIDPKSLPQGDQEKLALAAKLLATLNAAAGGVGTASPEAAAKMRVENVLSNMKASGTSLTIEAQTAICQYAQGVNLISDRESLGAASDGYDRWRQEKDLYRQIESYAVYDAQPVEQDGRPAAIVAIQIDGNNYRLLVEPGKPLRWVD